MRVKKVPHEAAAAGFGKSAKCETSRWNLVRLSSDGYTLSACHLSHLPAGVLALAVAKAGACCLSPHRPCGEIALLSICSSPLCWDRLGEGTADMGELKCYRLLLLSSAQPICQGL